MGNEKKAYECCLALFRDSLKPLGYKIVPLFKKEVILKFRWENLQSFN